MRLSASRLAVASQGRGLGNALWDLAGAIPSLDQRFAEDRSLVDAVSGQQLITFSRASDGTATNSSGNLIVVPAGTPRFDHNPLTGESLGLLVEEQRVNSIRNNTMVGAVAGTPGTAPTNWSLYGSQNGLTQEIVGVGTENGIDCIDIKWSGTTTAAITSATFIATDVTTAAVAATGQTWTSSAYIRVVAGSFTGLTVSNMGCEGFASNQSYVEGGYTTFNNFSASLAGGRVAISRTFSGAVAFARQRFIVSIPISTTIDITLRIGLPQLEQGAFATSVIPTFGASAVTRAADVCSISGSNFSSWFSSTLTDHTFFVQAVPRVGLGNSFALEGFQGVGLTGITFSLDGLGTRFRLQQRHGSSRVDTGSNYPTWVAGSSVKCAIRTSSASMAAYNGALSNVGGATQQFNWTNSSGISIGSRGQGQSGFFNNCISRITFWPQPLSDSTLQSITQ
jgi:hypothetical protein